jgi:hypothetical protein
MIIRIMGEGQYRVDSCLLDDLNKIDNRIVDHVSKGDQKKFKKDLGQMISTIKEKGEPLDPAEILPSDVIVPPENLTLDEARRVFSGQGLIED